MTTKYPAIAEDLAGLPTKNAYLDGELCGVLPDGRTAFNLIQNASDTGQGALVFFLFDLLFLDGEDLTETPLVERKARLEKLLTGAPLSLVYNDHQIGQGPAFHRLACPRGLEGIISKRLNGRYEPDRRSWLKTKCLNREEFVVVGWSDPEGSRHRVGSLLLGYYTPDGKLIYAGRAGTGMSVNELERGEWVFCTAQSRPATGCAATFSQSRNSKWGSNRGEYGSRRLRSDRPAVV